MTVQRVTATYKPLIWHLVREAGQGIEDLTPERRVQAHDHGSTWCGLGYLTSVNMGQGYAATCLRCYARFIANRYP